MSNIIKKDTNREHVGFVHKNEMGGDKVRFQDDRNNGTTQKIMLMKRLREIVDSNGWIIEKHTDVEGRTHTIIWNETVNHLCSDCEQDAMYDTEEDEFYCPRCHE